ncbi:MAG: alpha-1,4-glucan--maltose-1-phosphate maltosyltransferase, partial [Janthinobacterium lividum]
RRPLDVPAAREAGHWGRLAIENPSPVVDDGSLPVKRTAGELVAVEVDVLCDGHDKLAVVLQWRGPDEAAHETRMRPLGNDRYAAGFPLPGLGRYRYRIEAWRDVFESFRDELAKKHAAGVPIELEMIEGTRLVQAAAARTEGALQDALAASLAAMEAGPDARREALLSTGLAAAMAQADPRDGSVASERPIAVQAERIGARYASWYEVFPRSMSDDATRHGTFADVERHLPRVRDMGFDVLYFPPIHPIGQANRKGRNNTLTPGPEDVGSPYAIGSEDGGHDALHPQLGTLEDFRHLVAAAHGHGIEIAIDFAVQCSPDHPWLKEHRGWFDWRPDGSIKYAENPPKKYQDIVNVDFYAEDAVPGLWVALCDVVLFWAHQGVRLFRVDNPHTKPFPFWQWMIAEVQARFPDAIFLAEAFTRPKIMYRLAKVGFSQSYTYFTWRNTKAELEEYVSELADTAPRDFFRPHFFVNTPDINPPFLQTSGRPGHLIRAALAATLSGLWGVYSGFELCDATPLPGREEYLDSEKYEIRAWDWERTGNIVAEVTRLNRIRADNPALQTHLGVTFLRAGSDVVTVFEKATADRSNVVIAAISMDPSGTHEVAFDVPLWRWSLPDSATVVADELTQGERANWTGRTQRVRLTPERPYAIWRVRPA